MLESSSPDNKGHTTKTQHKPSTFSTHGVTNMGTQQTVNRGNIRTLSFCFYCNSDTLHTPHTHTLTWVALQPCLRCGGSENLWKARGFAGGQDTHKTWMSTKHNRPSSSSLILENEEEAFLNMPTKHLAVIMNLRLISYDIHVAFMTGGDEMHLSQVSVYRQWGFRELL